MTIIPWDAILKGSWRGFINLLRSNSCGDCVWIAEQEVNTFFRYTSICLLIVYHCSAKNLWQRKLIQVAIAAINDIAKWLKMVLAMNLTLEDF